MAKDLTASQIERQNVLNNTVALPRIQEALEIEALEFQGVYYVTKAGDSTGARSRKRYQIAKLEKEMHMKAIGVAESTQRVIASELQGKRSDKLLGE